MQVALPGFAPDPYRLAPVKPSYAKMVKQLETVARAAATPIEYLTDDHIADHGRTVGWSEATVVNLTRVAHAHGLDIAPHTSRRPKRRPGTTTLSALLITSEDNHPAQQRTAALATLMWQHPAQLHFWRRLHVSDLQLDGATVRFAGHVWKNAEAVVVWLRTVERLYGDVSFETLPFLVRIDDAPAAVAIRTIEQDWQTWMDGITPDRWRAWAIDAGAAPVKRGRQRHRHR